MNPNQDNKNNKGGQGPKKRGFFVGALLWALVLVIIFNFIAGEIANAGIKEVTLSLIHISEPTRHSGISRMPSSA